MASKRTAGGVYVQNGEGLNLKKKERKKLLEKPGMFIQEKAFMRHERGLQVCEEQPLKEKGYDRTVFV